MGGNNDIKIVKVGEYTVTTTANNPVKWSVDKNGFTIFEGNNLKITTEADTASKMILKGDNNTFVDGDEPKGSLPDEIKIYGDENSITAANKGTCASTNINGDNIFLKGDDNEIQLGSGNKLRMEGLSSGNKIHLSQACDVSNATGSMWGKSENTIDVMKTTNINTYPSEVGIGEDALLNIKLPEGTQINLRKPGRFNEETGIYQINKEGQESTTLKWKDFKYTFDKRTESN